MGPTAVPAVDCDSSSWTRTYDAPHFPLYDGHGNMVATLARDGQSYDVGNSRQYDVWGGVRSGASTGDPDTRYCANLGHRQDDESGLIYMRARYYEPGTGRFISEDPARDGWNWYVYCGNEPVSRADPTGKESEWDSVSLAFGLTAIVCLLAAGVMAAGGGLLGAMGKAIGRPKWSALELNVAWMPCGIASVAAALSAGFSDRLSTNFFSYLTVCGGIPFALVVLAGMAQLMGESTKRGMMLIAGTAMAAYTGIVLFLLVQLHGDEF